MKNLIAINLDKRLSILSIIFIFISLVLIIGIFIYQASFDVNNYETLNNIELLKTNYLIDSLQTIEIITVFFIIVLVALELFYNTNNFDAYFITLTTKRTYLISKIISYLAIIFLYISIIFSGLIVIYMIRFNDIDYLKFIDKIIKYYLIYFLCIFILSYLVLLAFRNYFSSIFVFVLYWISKVTEEENNIKKNLFLNISIDYTKEKINFSFANNYLICYLFLMFVLCFFIYEKKDLKINS